VTWLPNQPRPEHVYAAAGNKTVSVRGRNPGSLDNCNSNTQAVTALATLPPPVISQLQVVDNTSVQLAYNNQSNILYRLEVATNGASSFQLLKTSYNTTSETVGNLKTEDNYYCFRLGAFDPCNNTTVYSNIICSSNFDLSVQNNSNNLSWSTNTIGSPELRLSQTTPGNIFTTTVTTSPYADTNIQCGTEYCYQLTTNYPNGSQSISLEKCGTAISTDAPAAIENITLIVGQPGVQIQWQPVTGFTPDVFSVFRSANNVDDLLTTTTALQATDETYDIKTPVCYKISYEDVCGNASPFSAEACPIQLSGRLQKDNAINLTWTPYSGWRDGVSSYIVEKYSAEGQLLQTLNAGANLTLLDDSQDFTNQLYTYVVKAVAVEGGLPEAASNRITIIKDPNLFYPTAFTPNGDNLNDIFNVFGQYIVTFEMNIFNRWGELMYSTTELDQGWDGYFKGNPMPEGTYTFVADITDSAGRTFKRSGSVVLLKKK
jgi:gliding motility-associated-like protein